MGPAKPKEADGEESRLDTREIEAAFGSGGELSVVFGNFLLVDREKGRQDGADTESWTWCYLREIRVGGLGESENDIPAKTAPFCCRSKWWLAVKTSGIELKVR